MDRQENGPYQVLMVRKFQRIHKTTAIGVSVSMQRSHIHTWSGYITLKSEKMSLLWWQSFYQSRCKELFPPGEQFPGVKNPTGWATEQGLRVTFGSWDSPRPQPSLHPYNLEESDSAGGPEMNHKSLEILWHQAFETFSRGRPWKSEVTNVTSCTALGDQYSSMVAETSIHFIRIAPGFHSPWFLSKDWVW